MKAKELAKLLGVSPATVSLVLNGKPGVSDGLRADLLDRVRELGYGDMIRGGGAPAAAAGEGGRQAIAFLSYLDYEEWDQAYAFFPGVLEGAEMEARDLGCNLVVFHMKRESGAPLSELLRRGGVVGAIVRADRITPALLEDVASLDVPCVFMDSYDPRLNISSVNVDNRQSMYAVVRYLKERGHREIGYVATDFGSDYQEDRYFSFRRALLELDLPSDKKDLFVAGYERGPFEFQRLAELFAQAGELPTALVAENDRAAMRAVNALKSIGRRVPEDVSVVGFDNNPLCRAVEPNLTSVKNSRHLMGRELVMLLQNLRRLKALGIPAPRLKYRLPTELVERDSVCDGPFLPERRDGEPAEA